MGRRLSKSTSIQMGKLQEEQIQQQINFYNKRTIQDMIDGVQTECH